MSVLDTHTGRLVRTIPLAGATAIALSARTRRVFVRTFYNTVAVLDARNGRVVKIVPVAPYVRYAISPTSALAVDEARRRVFVPGDRRTLVLDASTGRVLRTLAVPGYLVAVNGANGRAFVAADGVSAPPTNSLFGRTGVSSPPRVSSLDLSRR